MPDIKVFCRFGGVF